jgi:hypothetical protein
MHSDSTSLILKAQRQETQNTKHLITTPCPTRVLVGESVGRPISWLVGWSNFEKKEADVGDVYERTKMEGTAKVDVSGEAVRECLPECRELVFLWGI